MEQVEQIIVQTHVQQENIVVLVHQVVQHVELVNILVLEHLLVQTVLMDTQVVQDQVNVQKEDVHLEVKMIHVQKEFVAVIVIIHQQRKSNHPERI